MYLFIDLFFNCCRCLFLCLLACWLAFGFVFVGGISVGVSGNSGGGGGGGGGVSISLSVCLCLPVCLLFQRGRTGCSSSPPTSQKWSTRSGLTCPTSATIDRQR